MSVGPAEEALQAGVAPVQVDPLSDTETEDHIVLLLLWEQQLVRLENIVSLWRNEERMISPKTEHNLMDNDCFKSCSQILKPFFPLIAVSV